MPEPGGAAAVPNPGGAAALQPGRADGFGVDVILPVLDEAAALPWVLDPARWTHGYRPLVVDNGSTDNSGDIARALGARVISEPIPGFGAACWAGLQVSEGEIVAFLDADASLDPLDLPLVVDPVRTGAADLVLGERRPAKGAWPPHARLANRFLAGRVRHLTGITVRDLGPMRACRRQPLIELGLQDRRFGWPLEMVLRAAEAGWRIDGRAVPYHPRAGRSKVTGTLKGTVAAVRDMRRLL